MSDPRRLLGRLNPTGARYDSGRGGGTPELTPQDIAAALGMLRDPKDTSRPLDELARETFCAIWWPDGARLTRRGLLAIVGLRQYAEVDRQWRKVQIARLEVHIARDGIAAKGCTTAEDLAILDRLEAKLAQARKACWPAQPAMFTVVRDAVLSELASPNHCQVCEGRGEFSTGTLVVRCQQCDGAGTAPVSDRQRAARIQKDAGNYGREWRGMYEWTYNLLRDAEADALRAMRAALSMRDAA